MPVPCKLRLCLQTACRSEPPSPGCQTPASGACSDALKISVQTVPWSCGIEVWGDLCESHTSGLVMKQQSLIRINCLPGVKTPSQSQPSDPLHSACGTWSGSSWNKQQSVQGHQRVLGLALVARAGVLVPLKSNWVLPLIQCAQAFTPDFHKCSPPIRTPMGSLSPNPRFQCASKTQCAFNVLSTSTNLWGLRSLRTGEQLTLNILVRNLGVCQLEKNNTRRTIIVFGLNLLGGHCECPYSVVIQAICRVTLSPEWESHMNWV